MSGNLRDNTRFCDTGQHNGGTKQAQFEDRQRHQPRTSPELAEAPI